MMDLDINQEFIDQYSTYITDNICISHGVDPSNLREKAILAYHILNPDKQVKCSSNSLSRIIETLNVSIIQSKGLNTFALKLDYVLDNLNALCNNIIKVYHGSLYDSLKPMYGKGKDNHDYGNGLYTTIDYESANEWAAVDATKRGYIHELTIDMNGLTIFNFNNCSVFNWIAELVSHRTIDIEDISPKILHAYINKYKPNIDEDIVIGWRADSAFFTIINMAANSRLSVNQLDTMLRAGDFGYQVFLRSPKAFQHIIDCKCIAKSEKDKYINYTQRCNKAIEEMFNTINNTDTTDIMFNFNELLRG